ncbi:potassium channel family protein [Lactiplantibacillus modestisalitolerans]|uniref:Potassium channel family protein n=1 Tax=Lactiplantibacillus modestisalitolerans TaxID=1457219 RepID=A0ABV5WRC5_9LACO|nr:potassium channel family protein [Lactiplantibacillus modestisalitolerans]
MVAKQRWQVFYHLLITGLTLLSVVNVLLQAGHVGDWYFEAHLNNSLLVAFAVDYFVRLGRSTDRKTFLIHSTFDLLGIIPMHPVFALFRIGRLVRMVQANHLFWKLGWDGRWTHAFHKFIYDTGFIYLFSISIAIIVLSALLFSVFEHQSLSDSLWWAITTATTVGYGDDTPHTAVGKVIAVGLMFGGIGFIGLLTSTITDFFTQQTQQTTDLNGRSHAEHAEDLQQLFVKVDQLTQKVDQLQKQVTRIEKNELRK